MPQSKFRVSGALFASNRQNGPSYSGFVEIDGVKTYLALWPKTSAAGNDYLQVSEDKKAQQQNAAPPRPGGGQGRPTSQRPAGGPVRPQARPQNDMDDDIPFNPERR